MKRVCIIHKVQLLDPRSFYKQGISLKKAGYNVTIMSFYNKGKEIDGIKFLKFMLPANRLNRFFSTNFDIFIKAIKEKADVYHFHDLDFVPWAMLLKLLTGKKMIYDIHEAHPEYMAIKPYIPPLLRKPVSFFVYFMEHLAIKFFDAILPNDNYIAKGFTHSNNVVLFNFPTLDFFRCKENVPYEDREYDLFYHGSLPTYHFKIMLDIAEKLNADGIRNRWGIIASPTSPLDWMKREVKNKALEDNFVFLPYVDYLKLSKYLTTSKIGIIPLPPYKKFMKNIPLKMFEFMGCGVPVVLSDLPPTRQFIEGKDCAIAVEPGNIKEYAKAITFLLQNPEKAIEMGNNGKKLVFEQYNWNIEEKKLLQLYNKLLNR